MERSVPAVRTHSIIGEEEEQEKKEEKKAGRKSDFLARRGCRGGGNREDEGKARVTYARS